MNEEEDFDFDFSQYESEEKEEDGAVETLSTLSKPRITGLKSRFSNWARDLERLANLEDDITKLSIQVASRTQDITVLWEFYGMLHAFWEKMRNIFGTVIQIDVIRIKKHCVSLLHGCSGRIPPKVHNNLLYLESVLITLKQRVNLGIETEKSFRGVYSKAKRRIIE